MALIVPDDAFNLVQGQLKFWTRSSDSGRPVVCGFCPDCGTRITHKAVVYEGFTNVRPGTLDDRSWLRPRISIWTKEKQPWIQLPEGFLEFETQP